MTPEPRWGLFTVRRHIPNLVRYVAIQCPLFHLYVHHIFAPDPGRHVHNHPWPGVAFVLWGGYLEEIRDLRNPFRRKWRSVRRGTVNYLPADKYHSIVSVKPNTWTVLVGGRRWRKWGFLVGNKHVDSATYIKTFSRA